MKIAIIGYGKMGKMIEQSALSKGHSIIAKIDPKCPPHTSITAKALADTDVCIDFTHPSCALEHIKQVAALKKNLVMGTTGWYEHLDEARHIVEKAGIGFVYAPNFSLGIALFLDIIAKAAAAIAPFDNYDVSGLEIHHSQKIDKPSGTAKSIIAGLQAHMPSRQDIHFASVRVGKEPGTHTVIFDSPVDSITLTHTARNREGFADGAVAAAAWLAGKKGFFTLEDMVKP